eukprot:scaffold107_cov215-Alexandrium_tamarense.AAC.5
MPDLQCLMMGRTVDETAVMAALIRIAVGSGGDDDARHNFYEIESTQLSCHLSVDGSCNQLMVPTTTSRPSSQGIDGTPPKTQFVLEPTETYGMSSWTSTEKTSRGGARFGGRLCCSATKRVNEISQLEILTEQKVPSWRAIFRAGGSTRNNTTFLK